MNSKIKACIIAITLTGISPSALFAQNKKSKAVKAGPGNTSILYLPEFYHPGATHAGDTTFKYECYDSKDKMIHLNTSLDAKAIDEVWYVKSFYDSRYGGGVGISPPYFTSKIVVYSKVDKDSWLEVDMQANEKTMLREYPGNIVRADTTIVVDPLTGDRQFKVRKYYKVSKE